MPMNDTLCVGKDKMNTFRNQLEDITGRRYGMLEAIEFSHIGDDKHSVWVFKCDCGNIVEKRKCHVVSGQIRSCGCLLNKARKIAGRKNKTHGMKNTRIYRIWNGMKDRCNNPKSCNARYYYDRGVTVCEEWGRFEPFYKWAMENGYRDDLSIDRINPYGNYEPSNCRWATAKEQANNKRKVL